MKVGIVTQARMTSTRLPGKVLLPLGDRTVLDLHLDRLASSGLTVVVATTDLPGDDAVVARCEQRGVPVYRGSETDVLGRFAGCSLHHGLDVVVRVTSDCPLVDGRLVRGSVDAFLEADDPWLYVSNTLQRTWPRGFDHEVFSAEALLDADEHATQAGDREHVTPYLLRNASGRMHFLNRARPEDRSSYRITLDTADDLAALRSLVEGHAAAGLDADGIIAVLDDHPEVVALNAHVAQKQA